MDLVSQLCVLLLIIGITPWPNWQKDHLEYYHMMAILL